MKLSLKLESGMIRYLKMVKCNFLHVISHKFASDSSVLLYLNNK